MSLRKFKRKIYWFLEQNFPHILDGKKGLFQYFGIRRKIEQPKVIFHDFISNGVDIKDITSRQLQIKTNIELAIKSKIKLPRYLRNTKGMSGQGYRRFINHLLRNFSTGTYLEIGIFRGSTSASALWENNIHGFLIDNWSEFNSGKNREIARNLLNRGSFGRFVLVDSDCFSNSISYEDLKNVVVFFYDGDHKYESQLKAASNIIDRLDFINLVFIVDDWRWPEVVKGTLDGLGNLKSASLLCYFEIYPSEGDDWFQYGDWHNGYGVFLIGRNLHVNKKVN